MQSTRDQRPHKPLSTVDASVPNPYPCTGIDFDNPSSSRISIWLSGRPRDQVWEHEHRVAPHALEIFPGLKNTALLERSFTDRAVQYCLDRGVRQFLVIGCGHPIKPTVHQIAERAGHPSRCVYVDANLVAVIHTAIDLKQAATLGPHSIFQADLRAASYIWHQAVAAEPIRPATAPDGTEVPQELTEHKATSATAVLDPNSPIAIILPWVLPFVTQDDQVGTALAQFKDLLPSGSLLIATHTTSDGAPDEQAHQLANLQNYFASVNLPLTYRDRSTFAGFFDGLELAEPTHVWASQWLAADDPLSARWADDPAGCSTLAAIGVKP